MEAIAVQRAVQLGTVQSYVAEAMAAGYPYPWHRLGVPHALLATFCAHLTAFQNYQNEVREQQQQEQLQPRNPQVHVVAQGLSHTVMDQQQVHSYGLPQQQSQPRALPQQQTAAQQSTPLIAAAEAPLHQQPAQLPGQVQVVQHAGSLLQQTHGPQTYDVKYKWQQRQMPQHWSQTAARHAVASAKAADPQGARSGIGTAQSIVQEEAALAGNQQDVQPQLWLQLDGTLTCQPHKLHVHETGAEHTGQHVVQLPVRGLVEEMVKTGQGIKALRDYIGPDAMSYGQMRIALAHLYRLALYPSARPGTFSPVHHIEGLFSVVS